MYNVTWFKILFDAESFRIFGNTVSQDERGFIGIIVQGIPCYGVSLNATGDKGITTDIHIRPLEGVKLSLDCAVAEFLSSDQLVISLKGMCTVHFCARRDFLFSNLMIIKIYFYVNSQQYY